MDLRNYDNVCVSIYIYMCKMYNYIKIIKHAIIKNLSQGIRISQINCLDPLSQNGEATTD